MSSISIAYKMINGLKDIGEPMNLEDRCKLYQEYSKVRELVFDDIDSIDLFDLDLKMRELAKRIAIDSLSFIEKFNELT